MNLSWMILPAFALVIGVAAFGVVVAAYSWGRFSSVQALQSAGSRGKAYLAALLNCAGGSGHAPNGMISVAPR